MIKYMQIIKNLKIYYKKHYHWQIPLFICLFIAFIGILGIYCNFWKINFSDFVLLSTFFAILWYSFETRELKISSQLTNELEQKPIIDLFYQSEDKKSFILKNNGKGVAYNIEIKFTGFNFEIVKFIYKFYFWGPNVSLFPNETKNIEIIEYENSNRLKGGSTALENFKNILASNENNLLGNPQFIICYDSINRKYQRIFNLYSNKEKKNLETQNFEIVFVEEIQI